MSPTVNNFVHDLVAMAKAMEDLPVVQAQADELARQNGELAHSVQAREESILKLKAEIDALHAKVRSTEAERDDAELRFLESEDRTRSALDFIKTTFGSAGSLIQALEPPPKVEPVAAAPEAEPIPVEQSPYYNAAAQGQSESNPISIGSTAATTDAPADTPQPSVPHTEPDASTAASVEVPKSDANPTTPEAAIATVDTQMPSVTPTDLAATTADDVGYHNEPDVGTDWSAWNVWCERMRQRHNAGAWPQRPDNAAPSVA